MGVVNNLKLIKDLIANRKKELQIKVIHPTTETDLIGLPSGLYFSENEVDVDLSVLPDPYRAGAGWVISGFFSVLDTTTGTEIVLLGTGEQYTFSKQTKQVVNWKGYFEYLTAWGFGLNSTGNSGQVLTKTGAFTATWQNK